MKLKNIMIVLSVIAFSTATVAGGMNYSKENKNSKDVNFNVFKMLDKDGDGKLSEEEFKAGMEKFSKFKDHKNNRSEKFDVKERKPHKAMVKKFDEDGDGKLSKEENKNMGEYIKNKFKCAKDDMLKRFDTDKDGKFSVEEREKIRESKKGDFDTSNARLCKKYDKNKDGRLNREEIDSMSFDDVDENFEFLGMMKMHNSRQKFNKEDRRMQPEFGNRDERRPHRAMIEKFDIDGDGKLSKEENDTMREFIKNRMKGVKENLIQKFDTDKDGKLSKEERDNIRETKKADFESTRAKLCEKYDVDKDGKLNREEIDSMNFEDLDENFEFLGMMRMHNSNKKFNKEDRRMGPKSGNKMDKYGCGNESDRSFNNGRMNFDRKGHMNNQRMRSEDLDETIREYHMLRYDKDKNGFIDRNERKEIQKEYDEYLKKYDVDKDGRLSADEKENFDEFMKKVAKQYLDTRNRL